MNSGDKTVEVAESTRRRRLIKESPLWKDIKTDLLAKADQLAQSSVDAANSVSWAGPLDTAIVSLFKSVGYANRSKVLREYVALIDSTEFD